MPQDEIFRTRDDAIRNSYDLMTIGSWLGLHRDIADIQHINSMGCECGIVMIEKKPGQSKEAFLREARQQIGN